MRAPVSPRAPQRRPWLRALWRRVLLGRGVPRLRLLWVRLREWSGDAAYDIYVARARGGEVLDRKTFYLDSLRSRYERPNRCC